MKITIPLAVGQAWENTQRCLVWLGFPSRNTLPRNIKLREKEDPEEAFNQRTLQIDFGEPGFYIRAIVFEDSSSAGNLYDVHSLRVILTQKGQSRREIILVRGEIEAILHRPVCPGSPDEHFPEALSVREKWKL